MVLAVRPIEGVTPVNNKYLAHKWDQDIFNAHRQKVASAKAVIDNNPPRVPMHLHINLKKLMSEAERLAMIERDNRILLDKMAQIMRKGGVVDNIKKDYHLKSLNKIKRQRELLRITHENFAILKRLTKKDPHYNHKKWHLQWQVNQHYLLIISKYPHPWRQEQSPYISQLAKQHLANKVIKRRVNTASNSPNKSKTGTPTPRNRSPNKTPAPVIKTPKQGSASTRSNSRQSERQTATVTAVQSFAEPEEANVPSIQVVAETEDDNIPVVDETTV